MNIKRVVEKLKVEKEDADAEKQIIDPAEFSAYAWELLGKAERGELPQRQSATNTRKPDAPISEGRAWLDRHLDNIAARVQGASPKGEMVKDALEVEAETEADDLDTSKYLDWVRNRYRV
jgi:hypothetical protein